MSANSDTSGEQFGRSFNLNYDHRQGLRQGGNMDRLRDRLVAEEHAKTVRQGFRPATIVNLNPFPLRLGMGDVGTIEVPACPADQPYIRHEILKYRFSMRDMGDGSFSPVSVLPRELAEEVVREYSETGGVFWYEGVGEVPSDSLAEARTRQVEWYRNEFRKAVDSWTRFHQHKLVTDRQRDAARALYANGEISSLPEWITITRDLSEHISCPACDEKIRRNAKVCRYCGRAVEQSATKPKIAEK
jgi:hypothetical protein